MINYLFGERTKVSPNEQPGIKKEDGNNIERSSVIVDESELITNAK